MCDGMEISFTKDVYDVLRVDPEENVIVVLKDNVKTTIFATNYMYDQHLTDEEAKMCVKGF
jgi:hypothetical protein